MFSYPFVAHMLIMPPVLQLLTLQYDNIIERWRFSISDTGILGLKEKSECSQQNL